jgi:AcrR family transcriptional regulator
VRDNQKARTRAAIVRAAGALLRQGGKVGLDEIAEAAGVSRATAYRYFPGLDALLGEATVDLLMPQIEEVLGPDAPTDPFERLALVDDTFERVIRDGEVPLRLTIAKVIERSVEHKPGDPPFRQNRRGPLIEQALAPLAPRLGKARVEMLVYALTMVIGTESFLALNDVAGLDPERAREVRRWTIDALVTAALKDACLDG